MEPRNMFRKKKRLKRVPKKNPGKRAFSEKRKRRKIQRMKK